MSVIGERIPSEMFNWSKEGRTFVAEISSLRPYRVLRPLYDDACDQGFQLVSQWSGNVIPMALAERKGDGEDIVVWIFRPTAEAVRKVPVCAGIEVHILND